MKILFLAPINFNTKIKRKLKGKYNVNFLYGISKNKLKKVISSYDILVTNPGSTYRYDSKILSFAKKLNLIITPSTGTDHIDYDYCKKNKIRIRCLLDNRKILNSISASAEFTLFLIFLTLRKFKKVQKIIKNGSWRKTEDEIRGNEIQDKTIGIVGFGRIGRKLYKYLKSFGCIIKIYDPYIKSKNRNLNFVKSLKIIFEKCDIISLNLSLNDQTTGIINNKYLNILKKNQIEKYLINNNIDLILHCAGLARVKECQLNKHKAKKINIDGTENIVKSILKIKKNKKKDIKLVFISSDAVYAST